MTTKQAPGTWRDGDPPMTVAWPDALAAWIEATEPVLEQVAARYGGSITYKELAEELFERTGVRTQMLLGHWIGKVLSPVQNMTLTERKPPLTALVVTAEGRVGDGYINHEHPEGFTDDAQRQRAAAVDRLSCYRMYCDRVPADAEPRMTDLYVARRPTVRKRAPKPPPQPVKACPTCFMVMPASGACRNCS